MKSNNFLPTLKTLYERRDTCSTALRRQALQMLGSTPFKGPALTAILAGAATGDPDSDVRQGAINLLRTDSSQTATAAIARALTATPDQEVQRTALQALSARYTSDVRRAVRDFALQPEIPEELRGRAAQMLGRAVDVSSGQSNTYEGSRRVLTKEEAAKIMTENSAYLREIFPKLETQSLKNSVLASLAQFGGEQNMNWLVEVAGSKEQLDIRRAALSYALHRRGSSGTAAIGLIGTREASPKVIASVYARLDERSLKQQVISYLGDQKDDTSLETLVTVAKSDNDSTIRQAAMLAIRRSPHPGTQKALTGIVLP